MVLTSAGSLLSVPFFVSERNTYKPCTNSYLTDAFTIFASANNAWQICKCSPAVVSRKYGSQIFTTKCRVGLRRSRLSTNLAIFTHIFFFLPSINENPSLDASVAKSNVGARLVDGRVIETKIETLYLHFR